MSVPEAPAEVHAYWGSIPNRAEINLLFKPLGIGPAIRVKCEGWGQLADDDAATCMAFYHIRNKRPMWWAHYVGWEEIGGDRKGVAPIDFPERYHRHWANLDRGCLPSSDGKTTGTATISID